MFPARVVGVGLTFAYGLVLGYAPRRQLLAPFITHVLTDLVELTVAKTLGVLALLIPSVPLKVKEFAYFDFAITLVSASIAHFAVEDAGRPPLYTFYIVDPLIFLGRLMFPIGTSTS